MRIFFFQMGGWKTHQLEGKLSSGRCRPGVLTKFFGDHFCRSVFCTAPEIHAGNSSQDSRSKEIPQLKKLLIEEMPSERTRFCFVEKKVNCFHPSFHSSDPPKKGFAEHVPTLFTNGPTKKTPKKRQVSISPGQWTEFSNLSLGALRSKELDQHFFVHGNLRVITSPQMPPQVVGPNKAGYFLGSGGVFFNLQIPIDIWAENSQENTQFKLHSSESCSFRYIPSGQLT